MAHRRRRLARAGALAWLVLAAGLLSLPASASPSSDEPAPTAISLDTASAPDTDTPPSETPPPDPPTSEASPSEDTESTSTVEPAQTASGTEAETATQTPTTQSSSFAEPTVTPAEPTAATATGTATPIETVSATNTESPSETATPTLTATSTPTGHEPTTPTPTATLSVTPTVTPEARSADPSFDTGSVLINEVGWAGTLASTSDEWIELWNPGPDPIDLAGWTLTDGGDITVVLAGAISPFGLFLLERTDDQTVADIAADRIYTGSLNNGGETLELIDPSANLIDTANAAGGAWPAGDTAARASMERHGALDVPGNWSTFPGVGGNGIDADGHPIAGTPRRPNAPSAPLASPTPVGTPTDTPTQTPTQTPTPSPTSPGPVSTPFPPEAIIINEVAWAGTLASSSDEWIELLNPGSESIDLSGWTLTDDDDIDVALGGSLSAGAYYLLERSDEGTISDISADRIYTGALSNSGETLRLVDPTGAEIDVVNRAGAAWPAGDASDRSSMERRNGAWWTFNGFNALGLDADGHRVRGTPRGPNSILFPTPLPTWIPGQVVINEVLMLPRHDWEGAGGVTTDDEFIELYNRGPGSVSLRGWTLDDYVVGGSSPFDLPAITLPPGEFAVFFRSRTGIALNDNGDSVRLSAPDGSPVDKIRYLPVKAVNLSFGRLPDGDDVLAYGLWPTPRERNVLFVPPSFPVGSILINEVAWAGTAASASDEWIELWNPGREAIHLDGWRLTDDGDLQVELTGSIAAGGFLILERTDDRTISNVAAEWIYTGGLANDGERLRLVDPSGAEVDVVDASKGGWPAGDREGRASMERVGDRWATYGGDYGRGHDAAGAPVLGTPGAANSQVVAEALAATASCIVSPPRRGRLCP